MGRDSPRHAVFLAREEARDSGSIIRATRRKVIFANAFSELSRCYLFVPNSDYEFRGGIFGFD